MKKTLLLAFLGFSATLLAQKTPRTVLINAHLRAVTYNYILGEDSVRYTITDANDTLVTEFFWLNGLPKQTNWGKDSTYYYYKFGILAAKKYLFYDSQKQRILDSTVMYNMDNGQVIGLDLVRNGYWANISFDEHQQLKSKQSREYISSKNYSKTYVNDILKRSISIDTIMLRGDSFRIYYDTTYYNTSQIKTIESAITSLGNSAIKDRYSYNAQRFIHRNYYDTNGRLVYSMTPDSLQYYVFKDNVNCYYGFQNGWGDTLIAPHFDNVVNFVDDNQYFLCEEGDTKTLMAGNGQVLMKDKMQVIKPIMDDNISFRPEYEYDYGTFLNRSYQKIRYFAFRINNKWGLIDSLGRVILPPQYEDEIVSYDSKNQLLSTFIQGSSRGNYLPSKQSIIDVSTGKEIGKGLHKRVTYNKSKLFFTISETKDSTLSFKLGLINKDGVVVLPPQYIRIIRASETVFWVQKANNTPGLDEYGLFDAEHKRWILEPYYKSMTSYEITPQKNNILYATTQHKSGILDSSFNWVLPPVYDTIIGINNNRFIVAQNGQYTILDNKDKKTVSQNYEYLGIFLYHNQSSYEGRVGLYHHKQYFIAKKQGKWGIIDDNETTVVPFEYDYAGQENHYLSEGVLALIKNDKVSLFRNEFFPKPISRRYFEKSYTSIMPHFITYLTKEVFILNEKMEMMIPPQYTIISTNQFNLTPYLLNTKDNVYIVEHKQTKERRIVFSKQKIIRDFPFKKPLLWADAASPLVFLGQTEQPNLEVAHLDGRVIQRIKQGGLAIGDTQKGTYFVKKDVPILPKPTQKMPSLLLDTLATDDNGWFMYDVKGKQIAKESFRLPIEFNEGIGWGIVGEKYGLWRSDGSVVLPPQYENVFYDKISGTYAFFQNVGINNWLVLFDKTGKQLINTGRYDGISAFYGKYALVKKGDEVGLIDSLGKEIVPLTALSASSHINFRDSLLLVNKNDATCRRCDTLVSYGRTVILNLDERILPIYFASGNKLQNNPDSLKITAEQRNIVWNWLVENFMKPEMHTAGNTELQKPKMFKTYKAYNNIYRDYYNARKMSGLQAPQRVLLDLFIDSTYFSFSIIKDSISNAFYYNFVKRGNNWYPLSTQEFFNLTPDNTRKMNDLLSAKINLLKNKDIDCGSFSSFWERGDHHYLVTKEGINFYFMVKLRPYENSRYLDGLYFQRYYESIPFTWAELKPYLRY